MSYRLYEIYTLKEGVEEKMNSFMVKYGDGLEDLKSRLDCCIQDMWRTVDYANGERSELLIDKGKIVVLFGDTDTANRAQLAIDYSEEGDSLFIRSITPIPQLTNTVDGLEFKGAYSENVLSLVGCVIRGRSEREMIRLKIAELEKQRQAYIDRITNLKNMLNKEKAAKREIETDKRRLENKLEVSEDSHVEKTVSNREELRELMHTYNDRYKKLLSEYEEAKALNDDEAMIVAEALLKQCRVMTVELWHVMIEVGALDKEEIEFGSIRAKNQLVINTTKLSDC